MENARAQLRIKVQEAEKKIEEVQEQNQKLHESLQQKLRAGSAEGVHLLPIMTKHNSKEIRLHMGTCPVILRPPVLHMASACPRVH